MMKYRNEDRDAQLDAELEALEEEYKQKYGGDPTSTPAPETPLDEPSDLPVIDKEEETWKKRHGDLRSYTSKQISALQKEVEDMKKALAEKEREKFPANKAEAEEWVSNYPDLARVIGTLIDERAEKHVTSVSDEVKTVRMELEAEREAVARERAMTQVLKVHPDFMDLIQNQDFKDWVEEQPTKRGPRIGQALYDALYDNNSDADSAIQAVNVYKADKAASKPQKDTTNRDAATTVRRTSSSAPVESNGKRTFTESEIESMKPWDYDKLETAIEEARREGRIVYDISGAAR